jgi:hypothetical protein
MPTGDIYGVSIDMTMSSQAISCGMHFEQDGDDGTDDARDAIASIWEAVFKGPLKACMVDNVNIVQLRIRRVFPTETQARIVPIGEVGDDSSNPNPIGSCCLIRLISSSAGRKGTGGQKLPGASIFDVNEGRVNVSYGSKLQTYGDVFTDSYTDGTSGYKFFPGVYSIADNVCRQILAAQVVVKTKTVHSRQIGVGE